MPQVYITCTPGHGFAGQSVKSDDYGLYLRDHAQRFWAKVERRGDGECWPWQASKLGRYGQFIVARRGLGMKDLHLYAHRIAWVLCRWEIPESTYVCHTCDNPICVNPHHLFLGTHTDNMQDASRKGRLSIPRIKNRHVKTEAIRRYFAGGVTLRQLADEYGVHMMTVQ